MKAMLAISISRMPDSVNTATKEGIAWGIGNDEDVAWIKENTASRDCTITVAIPAVFADYATLLHPGGQLGYLDTGASDIVFWDAPKTTLCCGWNYVLVRAGPQQAASWRPADSQYDWKSTELPELMFPADRSWLVSTLWDDDWTCVGSPTALIADMLQDPQLARRARRVTADQDVTPPEMRQRCAP